MSGDKKVPEIRFEGFSEEWEERKLEDVAVFNPKASLPPSFKYVDLESVVGTSLVSIRTENKDTAPSRAQRLAVCKDIFFQTVRPYQRNNFLFDLPFNDFVFSSGYAQLRPNIDSNFLFNIIQKDEFVFEVLDYCTGTGYPAITPTNLALIEIFISLDIKEQTAIGNFFRSLDNTIALKKQQHEKTLNIKKAMLEKMFPKKGESVPEIRFEGFTGDWEELRLSDFGKATSGTSIESEFVSDGKYKVISIGSYSENSKYTDQKIRANLTDKIKLRILNNGDLTMILNDKTSAGNILGRVLLIDSDDSYVYNQRTQRIEPNHNDYCVQFIYQLLNAPLIRSKIVNQAQGNTQIYVNWPAICKTVYFAPKKEEQIAIGNFFRGLDTLIEAQKEEIEKMQSIKNALLNKMFV